MPSHFSYDEAIKFITTAPAAKKDLFRAGDGFERARQFFELLGNPQDKIKSVHIAGTSGKGTVAYMIESLLRACGKTTGLTTSPHVYDIRERCIINGELISREDFAGAVSDLVGSSLDMRNGFYGQPTYFEMTSAIASKVFAEREINYGIIETGLGGLYDSTNTISRSDKLAVITKLGLDHTEILGDTIEKIAEQKAGILPANGEAVIWKSAPEALAVVRAVAAARDTKLHIVDESLFTILDDDPNGMTIDYHDASRTIEAIKLPAGGRYQAENAVVAVRSVLLLAERDGFKVSDQMVRDAMRVVGMPGRVERMKLYDRDVIFDGAHNPQKITAFLEVVDALSQKPIVVVGLKKTKDADEILRLIRQYADKIIVTEFFTSQDSGMINASYTAIELARIVDQLGGKTSVYADSLEAVQEACRHAKSDQAVVVTGSFYLLGEIHDKLEGIA
ncbi:MAG TPA: Mur ligase family protein [Candidatus Saccharimonadales bacterium]